MIICHKCAEMTRVAFPQKELKQIGDAKSAVCGHCRKRRYCTEYEIVSKQGRINLVTSSEIVKLFREGLCIDILASKERAQQKAARAERRDAYRKQIAFVKNRRETDKTFKLPPEKKVVVGPPVTKFEARAIVERAIYDDLMKTK